MSQLLIGAAWPVAQNMLATYMTWGKLEIKMDTSTVLCCCIKTLAPVCTSTTGRIRRKILKLSSLDDKFAGNLFYS